MYFLDKTKQLIVKEVNGVLGQDLITDDLLVYPPNKEMGDLSLPCFSLAKSLGKNPPEVAEFLLKELTARLGNYFSLQVAGPYLNFKVNLTYLTRVLLELEESGGDYGQSSIGSGKRVMIEYSNVNTHKEYHIGHLRNLCYGDSVYKVLAACGYKAIPVSYINDFGIHVAKTLWAYNEFLSQGGDISKIKNKGQFLGKLYVEASQKLKEQPHFKEVVGFLMKKIESRQGEEYELWKKTRKWSIEQFAQIYDEMNIKFEHIFYENEFIEEGLKMVDELTQKGILKRSQGAIIADLSEYDLGVLIIVRSDGTALYPVADLPLAREKFEKYKLDTSIYVVDNRQSLYFKQLFKVLELIGYKQKMVHLAYDFVKLPEGMISSRTGNVITYEELYSRLCEKIEKETRERHPDWSSERIQRIVKILTVSTIKFEMLKVGAEQVIVFDINKALSFDGFTAAYLQYTVARINSILRKSEISPNFKQDYEDNLSEKEEHYLIIELAKFPLVIQKAALNYNPSEIAKYLFDLSRLFNDYYHRIPILKADEKTKNARLALITGLRQVIKNGLSLLGIAIVEEM